MSSENSNLREGRLEVWNGDEENGSWGTVCNNGFDSRAAGIVCNSLGYNSVAYFGTKFESGTGLIFLDLGSGTGCHGEEDSLLDCDHQGIGEASCSHSDDVGLICGRRFY